MPDYLVGLVLTAAALVLLWLHQPLAAVAPSGAAVIVLWRLLRRG